MVKLSTFDRTAIIVSAVFAFFSFILFFINTAEAMKSMAAAVFVFLLVWLSIVVLKWIFEMF